MYHLYVDGIHTSSGSHFGDMRRIAVDRYGARRCAITDDDRNTVWLKNLDPDPPYRATEPL